MAEILNGVLTFHYEEDVESKGLKILDRFTLDGYGVGPLRHNDSEAFNASYVLGVPASTNGTILYRLYGGPSPEEGQWYTLDWREGHLGDRMDLALPKQWNRADKKTTLFVPENICMFVGVVAPQKFPGLGGMHGGALQVFIPKQVVTHLKEANRNDPNTSKRNDAIEMARQAQREYLRDYNKSENRWKEVWENGVYAGMHISDPRRKHLPCPRCGSFH